MSEIVGSRLPALPVTGVTVSVPLDDIIRRISAELDRVYAKTGARPTGVILGVSEWAAMERWYSDSRVWRYLGTGFNELEQHAQGVLGVTPTVDPLATSRITAVYSPRFTMWSSPVLAGGILP